MSVSTLLPKTPLLRFIVVFFALAGAVSLLGPVLSVEFGNTDFWQGRGIFFGFWFLIFITIFPRLTLFFSSVPFGGIFWWLGFFFAPRLLVAFLATIAYWKQNPILVVIAWLVAIGGEGTEKVMLSRPGKVRVWFKSGGHRRGAKPPQRAIRRVQGDVIEAEYKVKD
jgi:hypothetical protein